MAASTAKHDNYANEYQRLMRLTSNQEIRQHSVGIEYRSNYLFKQFISINIYY